MIRAAADARATLDQLVGEPLEGAEFSGAVETCVRRVLDFDGWCLFGMDPATGFRIAQFGGRGTDYTTDLARNEAVMTDVNGFHQLARQPVPAGWLSDDHPGAAHSVRFNEMIRPSGFTSELRFLLRDSAGVWGGLTLFLESRPRAYDEEAVQRLAVLADPLTRAIRAFPALGRGPARRAHRAVADGRCRGAHGGCTGVARRPRARRSGRDDGREHVAGGARCGVGRPPR
jgi:hypothetical protein